MNLSVNDSIRARQNPPSPSAKLLALDTESRRKNLRIQTQPRLPISRRIRLRDIPLKDSIYYSSWIVLNLQRFPFQIHCLDTIEGTPKQRYLFLGCLRLGDCRPYQKGNGQECRNGNRSTVCGSLGISGSVLCLGIGIDLDLKVERR